LSPLRVVYISLVTTHHTNKIFSIKDVHWFYEMYICYNIQITETVILIILSVVHFVVVDT